MKKKQHLWMLLFASVMLVLLVSTPAFAESESGLKLGKNGRYCYLENGKKVKSQWREVNGKKYFFRSNGWSTPYSLKINGKIYVFNSDSQLCSPKKKRIFKSNGYIYYVNPDGTANTGWLNIKGKLYRASYKTGRFFVNRTDAGIRLGEDGAAIDSIATSLKIKTMQIVSEITNKGMSKSQKLRACWNYLVHSGRFYYRSTSPNIWKKGWQKEFALSMLVRHSGSCSSFACAFAALAAEIGYTPYVISGRVPGNRDGAADGMTRHCWVTIDGRHYDPEGTWAGWAGYIYGTGSYPIYHTTRQVINFKTYI